MVLGEYELRKWEVVQISKYLRSQTGLFSAEKFILGRYDEYSGSCELVSNTREVKSRADQ